LEELPIVKANPSFSVSLTSFLAEHRFHDSCFLALKIWLTFFLISTPSIKHETYPKILASHADFDDKHVLLIVALEKPENGAKMVNSYVFALNSIDPYAVEPSKQKIHNIVDDMGKKFKISKKNLFKYELSKEVDKTSLENVYQITRHNVPYTVSSNNLNGQQPQRRNVDLSNNFVQPMPSISSQSLDFFSQNTSLLDILVQYVTKEHFKPYLKHLGNQLTSEMLIRSLHSIVAGHFAEKSHINSATSVDLNGNLKALAVKSRKDDAFCSSENPIVFSARRHGKNDVDSLFYHPVLPEVTTFLSAAFISIDLACADSDCMSKTRKNKVALYPKRHEPKYVWTVADTESLMEQLKSELYSLNPGRLGLFLAGYFSSTEKFTQMFDQQVMIGPSVSIWAQKHISFALIDDDKFALIINVDDRLIKQKQTKDFEWFSNVYNDTKYRAPKRTHVVNILPVNDGRLTTQNTQYFVKSSPFVPGYRIMIEKEIKNRPSSAPSDRPVSSVYENTPIYLPDMSSNVDNTITIAKIIHDLPNVYKNTKEITMTLEGCLSQVFLPYKLYGVGYNLKLFKTNPGYPLKNDHFVTFQVLDKTFSAPNVKAEVVRLDKIVKQQKLPIVVHVVVAFVKNISDMVDMVVCRPGELAQKETICLTMLTADEHQTYPFSSVISVKSAWENNDINFVSGCSETDGVNETVATLRRFLPSVHNRNPLVDSVHKLLLYSMIGEIVKVKCYGKISEIGKTTPVRYYVNLTAILPPKQIPTIANNPVTDTQDDVDSNMQNNNPTKSSPVSNRSTVTATYLKNIQAGHRPWKNINVVPIAEHLYFGMIDDQKGRDDRLSHIFSLHGIHNLKCDKTSSSKIFTIANGHKAFETTDADDLIVLKKGGAISGYVNALKGSNTLYLINGHADNPFLKPMTIRSEEGPLMSIDDDLTIQNVQNLIGAKNSAEVLYISGGLELVNLRGGTKTRYDHVIVDMEKCSHGTKVFLDTYSKVDHVSSNRKVVYAVTGSSSVELRFKNVGRASDDVLIEIEPSLFDLTGIQNHRLSSHECSNLILKFKINGIDPTATNNEIKILGFDSNKTISFINDGFQLQVQNGKLYIRRQDCWGQTSMNVADRPKYEAFYRFLVKEGVIFVDQCPGQEMVVYTGAKVDHTKPGSGAVEEGLTEKYILLENDPTAISTYFEHQYVGWIYVYRIHSECFMTKNDTLEFSCIIAQVSLKPPNVRFILDLKQLTRPFEDQGLVIEIDTVLGNQPQKQLKSIEVDVVVGSTTKIVLAHIDFPTPPNWQLLFVVTSRKQFRFDKNHNVLSMYNFAINKQPDNIVIDYKIREKLFLADFAVPTSEIATTTSAGQKDAEDHMYGKHGDTLVYDQAVSTTMKASSIFLAIEPVTE